MIMVCHNLNPKIPSDVAFAESRVRAETIVAESVLHDMGAISMIGSDSQAIGRLGETFLRAIQTADAMKKARGPLPEDAPGNDNFRVLRYIAKVTINPALTAGVGDVIGSIESGKFADLVLGNWPSSASSRSSSSRADWWHGPIWATRTHHCRRRSPCITAPCSQPMVLRSRGPPSPSVSRAAYRRGLSPTASGLQRLVMPVSGTRVIGKAHMVRNSYLPNIEVDPQTFAVKVDGVHATVKPPQIDLAQPALFL